MPSSNQIRTLHPNHTTDPRQLTEVFKDRFSSPEDPQHALLDKALDYVITVADPADWRPSGMDVAMILHGLGADRATLLAGLLADPRLRDELHNSTIEKEFGTEVARLVRSTHWLNTFKDCNDGDLSAPQQAEGLRRLLLTMVEDMRAVLIKLAFRVQRLRLAKDNDEQNRRCIARETLDLYSPLANRLGVGQLKWELEDLAFRYLEPAIYKDLAQRLEQTRSQRETDIEAFKAELRQALAEEGIDCQVMGRPKHLYSIWRKMQRKNMLLEDLYDLRAVRVVATRIANCYEALGVVHARWRHIPSEFDDYIAHPKANGYQSLHTAVVGPQGRVFEVQIRTHEMHDFCEYGAAAHWRYKEGGDYDDALQRAVGSLRRLLESPQDDHDMLANLQSDLFADRVFVLTPQGDVKELPKGATPLDFAYAVHTEVGHRCRGAKVNGRIVPLTYTLQSGERVEILTSKQGEPSRNWLYPRSGYLATGRARAKVQQWFKAQDREKHLADGQAILEREMHRLGIRHLDRRDLVKRLHYQTEDELLLALGRGNLTPGQLAHALHIPDLGKPAERPQRAREPKRPPADASGVRVNGVGNLLTELAQCCQPKPGDEVVGFITRGKGVSVHRRDCPNILNLPEDKRVRLVEVDWGEPAEMHSVDIQIEAFDRQGLLRDVCQVLTQCEINVMSANTRTDPEERHVHMGLSVQVTSISQLSEALAAIGHVDHVLEARRVT